MEQQTTIPVWAIALIVVLLIVILIVMAIFFMRKRRTRSLSIDTIRKLDSEVEVANEKKPAATLDHSQESSSLTNASLPQVPLPAQQVTPQQQNEKTDRPTSVIDESDSIREPPKPSQEIPLALSPPSASFFSDKMELDDDHSQDFYNMMYSNSSKGHQGSEFISIDLNTPSIYSKIINNSSLKMSAKLKKIEEQTPVHPSNQFTALEKQQNIPGLTMAITGLDQLHQSTSTKQPFCHIDVTPQKSDNNCLSAEDEDESPITPNSHLQEPVRAAKRVIRSASKKTKRRSMVAPEPTIEEDAENDETKRSKFGSIRSKYGSVRYASVRGPKNGNGEHMTITSGSMRRLVRESILFDDDILPSIPVASSAAMVSTSNGPRKSNADISAVDIAGWWDNSKHLKTIDNSSKADSQSNEAAVSKADSASSSLNAPNQYRASLNTSVFAFNSTISKASGPSASLFPDNTKEDSNSGGVSRHNSFRRGTLGRNTLRSITANASHGVNRSLKGLFDYSSSNSLSNKVKPDDSQKMELSSETIMDMAEGKMAIADQQNFSTIRQKSIRASTSNSTRPSLPNAYLPTSESSTKYALSDEDEAIMLSDKLSKKTAIEGVSQPLPKLPISDDRKAYTQMKHPSSITPRHVSESPAPLTPVSGDVDNIRRMLQDTWISNSTSTYSMSSETDNITTASTTQPIKLNSRQQNQSLLTKSLLAQQVAKRGSLLAQHPDNNQQGGGGFSPQQLPEPSASFSSSTARTMISSNETSQTEPITMRQNAITQHGSNKVQSSSYESHSTAIMMDSPRNSSAESSRGHSRKSSGGNSAATALRISAGYAINAKTWNGGRAKRSSRISVAQQSAGAEEDEDAEFYDTLGSSVNNKRAFFSTMRKGQKTRGHIPWMNEEEEERTPAQIERDRYFENKA
jgi:hypothetical protein